MAWASQHKHRRSCFSRIASSFWHLGPWQSFDFQMKIVVLVRKVGSWKCGIWASVESTKLSHLSKSVWHTARKPSSKQEPAHWEWRAWHKEFTIWSFWLLFLKSKPSMESKKYYYQIYIYIYIECSQRTWQLQKKLHTNPAWQLCFQEWWSHPAMSTHVATGWTHAALDPFETLPQRSTRVVQPTKHKAQMSKK